MFLLAVATFFFLFSLHKNWTRQYNFIQLLCQLQVFWRTKNKEQCTFNFQAMSFLCLGYFAVEVETLCPLGSTSLFLCPLITGWTDQKAQLFDSECQYSLHTEHCSFCWTVIQECLKWLHRQNSSCMQQDVSFSICSLAPVPLCVC